MKGLHVVVTGGAGALGAAVVAELAGRGAACHVPRREDGVDLSVEENVAAWYRELPPIWASIHLAGGFAAAALVDTSLAAFRAQLDQNLVTCFLCCREAARALRRGGGGRIVNVAARPAAQP